MGRNLFSKKSKILLFLSSMIFLFFLAATVSLTKNFANFTTHITQTCKDVALSCYKALPTISALLDSPSKIIAFTLSLFVVFGMGKLLLSLAFAWIFRIKQSNLRFAKSQRVRNICRQAGLSGYKLFVFKSSRPLAYTYGFIKPKIYLSTKMVRMLDDKELEAVMLHEAAHVLRRDNIRILAMTFIRDVLIFLPVSGLLFKLFSREKEYEADDFAVSKKADMLGLASAIVKVSRLENHTGSPAGAMAFSENKLIEDRVKRLVNRSHSSPFYIKRLIVSFLASLIILASLFVAGFSFSTNSSSGSTGCNMASGCSPMNSTNCSS